MTREQVLAEGIPGGFSSLYDSLSALETIGVARRGYFVEGLGGAQFALPGAVERLRAQRDDDAAPPLVLAATDPAQPYGSVLKWPDSPRRPARQAGAYVISAGAEPVLFVERGGKGLQVLVAADDPRIDPALAAPGRDGPAGRIKRLAIEKIDGEPVVGSAYERAPDRPRLPRRAAQAHLDDVGRLPETGASSRRGPYSDQCRRATPSTTPPTGSGPSSRAGSRTRSRHRTRASGATAGPSAWQGRAVTGVDAHGKHLFLRFEGGLLIHSHLRMTGKWRVPRRRLAGAARTRGSILRRGERDVAQINGPCSS